MEVIKYKKLEAEEINLTLFSNFERYQDVKKCWRKENGEWILKDIAFVEEWNLAEYEYLIKCLHNTIETRGIVLGAFCDNSMVGFASVENEFFGSENEYLQLSSIHISNGRRGMGIGKQLFILACEKAKKMGAQKLYISAHSSQETQAYYKSMGCVEALEYNAKLVEQEPCDCQLEYSL